MSGMPHSFALAALSQPETQRLDGSETLTARLFDGEVYNWPDDELDIRQLRHHTKNALQRIMAMIAQAPGLHDNPAAELVAQELERRICLSADLSDALFGLTRAPGPMSERLQGLSDAVIEMMRDPDQRIYLDVTAQGICPPALREAALRVAHELVGNAVKHGMRGRASGRITLRLDSTHRRTRLWVIDDGWGIPGRLRNGEGLSLALGLAEQHDGTLRLWNDCGTVAVLDLPHEGSRG